MQLLEVVYHATLDISCHGGEVTRLSNVQLMYKISHVSPKKYIPVWVAAFAFSVKSLWGGACLWLSHPNLLLHCGFAVKNCFSVPLWQGIMVKSLPCIYFHLEDKTWVEGTLSGSRSHGLHLKESCCTFIMFPSLHCRGLRFLWQQLESMSLGVVCLPLQPHLVWC